MCKTNQKVYKHIKNNKNNLRRPQHVKGTFTVLHSNIDSLLIYFRPRSSLYSNFFLKNIQDPP